jgi:hypothetical protein
MYEGLFPGEITGFAVFFSLYIFREFRPRTQNECVWRRPGSHAVAVMDVELRNPDTYHNPQVRCDTFRRRSLEKGVRGDTLFVTHAPMEKPGAGSCPGIFPVGMVPTPDKIAIITGIFRKILLFIRKKPCNIAGLG